MFFFTLIELAKRWGKTESELLHAAAAGFIPLSFWYEGPILSVKPKKFYASYRGHGKALSYAIYTALVQGYDYAYVYEFYYGDNHYLIEKDPFLGLPAHPKLCIDLLKGFVVLAEDVAKIEKDRPAILFGDAPDLLPQEQSLMRSREPEKPLQTIKGIAEYCKKHEDTIKRWRKEYKDFPATPLGSGTVTALPSALNAWMILRGKKKS
ncbi:MAG: hypothetical protein KJ990_07545 [Proteobacteria bacterium]|nr:hypothetical protein [Pseudomonadota bacterium]MBU1648981.1 hypothetical protein [Pseudomonadota bacterium]